MDEGEIEAQSFVIKVWLEEIDSATGRQVWRGRVTHVPSGEQYAFTDLAMLVGILAAYVEDRPPATMPPPPGSSLPTPWKRPG